MNFKKFYFTESQDISILYTGQKYSEPNFDIDNKIGKGHDQEGPGFYFTTDKDDAMGYAHPNGIVITVENNFQNLITPETKLNKKHAIQLVKMAPRLDQILTDWGYDPPFVSKQSALNDLLNSVINEEDAKDTFLQIWYDCYYRSGNSSIYIQNMKKLGYDGLIIPKQDNVTHVVVYDPDDLVIVKVEKYKDLVAN